MEKIILEEHMTNLYAPTILAHKMTTENQTAEEIKRSTWKLLQDKRYKQDKIEKEKSLEHKRRTSFSVQPTLPVCLWVCFPLFVLLLEIVLVG